MKRPIAEIRKSMPKDEVLYDLAEFFKVFGDTTRAKIICVLFRSSLCVNDIASVLGMTQSSVSHHLRVLKTSRIVKHQRAGKEIIYSLDDEHIKRIFDEGFEHGRE